MKNLSRCLHPFVWRPTRKAKIDHVSNVRCACWSHEHIIARTFISPPDITGSAAPHALWLAPLKGRVSMRRLRRARLGSA